MVTSKPRSQSESQLIRVKSWTNQDQVLFVKVLRGANAIIGAKVSATMTLAFNPNGTKFTSIKPLPMYDNGYGDPDIMAGKLHYYFNK